MRYSAIVSPEAEADLTAVLAWYEEKRKGLGYDFVLQVDAGLGLSSVIPKFTKLITGEHEAISSSDFPIE